MRWQIISVAVASCKHIWLVSFPPCGTPHGFSLSGRDLLANPRNIFMSHKSYKTWNMSLTGAITMLSFWFLHRVQFVVKGKGFSNWILIRTRLREKIDFALIIIISLCRHAALVSVGTRMMSVNEDFKNALNDNTQCESIDVLFWYISNCAH